MKEDAALQRLADILPPPVPAWQEGWLLPLLGALFIIILVAAAWRLAHRRPAVKSSAAPEARQRLTALQQAWQARQLSARETAYQLATLLRLGLALPQLTATSTHPAITDAALWQATLAELNNLRYADSPHASLTPQLFTRIDQWLRDAARQAD